MDFTRNAQSSTSNPGPGAAAPAGAPGKRKRDRNKWNRILTVVIAGLVAILLIAIIVAIAKGPGKPEKDYVDSSRLQAVFLNTGQVYFGNITSLNNKYFVLTNIYYLQQTNGSTANGSNSSSAGSNVTLVKLGCELHEPYDQMVINSDQVTFWENLQDNGQVAKAVSTFEKQNPNGLKCADQSSSSSTNSSNAAQNAATNSSSAPSSSSGR